MLSTLRRVATPANIIATAALLVALSGTALAASTLADRSVTTPKIANAAVTGAKLANGSVTTPKLGKGAVNATKVKKGSLTADLFAPEVLGGLAASKVTVVPGTPVNVPAGSTGTTATAGCPAGLRAVAGGFNVGSFAIVDATGPTADGAGWSVTAETGGTPASISATVICVAP